MEAAIKRFFTSPTFAVAGASNDASKYGHKVFAWYIEHNLPVTPINPRLSSIRLGSTDFPTVVPDIASLSRPTDTSLSIVTPPAVTLKLLREAKDVGIPAVWMQPGSFDDEGLEFARTEFQAAVAGFEGKGKGKGGKGEGWCVLVDGEMGLSRAGRKWESCSRL
ncbi:MAG: hypothetical protein M1816_000054 [Peltula sp. TS41687]|nr:MAG: hypothetical protein M1816_000054 [Peltula sp. TS41687]